MNRALVTAAAALTVAGATAVGFAVHTLRGGDSTAAQGQERLAADFAADLAAGLDSTTTTAAEDDPTIATAPTVPGEDPAGPDRQTTTTLAAVTPEEAPEHGAALGRMLIPALHLDWIIVEGVDPADLAIGPGHMPGTALPGQPGNAVISGHRTTHGAPFYDLDKLQPGNRIIIETRIGTHVYEVVETVIVLPNAVWVTGAVDGAWLTLTACHPLHRATQRIVVFARLIAGPNAAAIAAALAVEPTPPQPPEG